MCDEIDNNCNDLIDDEDDECIGGSIFYLDQDSDGFGVYFVTTQACLQPEGYSTNTLDCDDSTELRSPNAVEICDGLDNNSILISMRVYRQYFIMMVMEMGLD